MSVKLSAKPTNDSTARYLSRLFNPGELICFTNDVTGTQLTTLEEAMARVSPANFVCLNPLATWRNDSSVTAHRNFLIEFDGLSLEEQARKLVDFDVPYSTLVYSGGKSLHAVIALTEGVTKEEYYGLFDLIRTVLWQSDPTARNPSRLTRAAGAHRADTGATQDLVDLRKRVSKEKLVSWLSRFSAHIERSQQRAEEERARRLAALRERQEAGATGIELVEERTLAFLRGDAFAKSSRHGRLVAAVFELFECGVDYDEALSLAEQAADLHGITADPKRAREAEQIVNYVYGLRRRSRG